VGDTALRLTGSPLAATAAEVLLDPLNAAGVLAAAKPAARAAAAGARQVGKAAKATGQSLGPKAAEMAEAYLQRAGMAPQIFIGKSAKTWDAASNARAAEMEAAGIPAQTIWRETGNWRAPDGQWRQEISDQGYTVPRIAQPITDADTKRYRDSVARRAQIEARANQEGVSFAEWKKLDREDNDLRNFQIEYQQRMMGEASAKLGELAPHRELLAAYPHLANISVRDKPMKSSMGEAATGIQQTLYLNPINIKRDLTAIHELQHFVQDIENFSPGGAEGSYLKDAPERLRQIQKERERVGRPALKRGYYTDEEKAKLNELMDREAALSPFGQYQRLMGEAESRAAEARMNLTPEERRAKFPEESYDVPIGELIDAPRAGKPSLSAETKTQTPEFKEWFGDSKVVDESGKPMVVYHGTGNGAFDFMAGARAFFTSSPNIASTYTRGRVFAPPKERGQAIYPVFLSLKNPLVVDAKGSGWQSIAVDVGEGGLGLYTPDDLVKIARRLGNDGLIIRNVIDPGPGARGFPRSQAKKAAMTGDVMVALDANQIKSAVGNRGTYDVRESDITKAQGGAVKELTMSYTTAADIIADKLMRQGMDPDQAFMTALRMSDARMKAGGAVLMAGGGDAERELTLQARNRNLAALDRALAPRARKTWDGPMIDRPIVNGKALVSAEELADFRRRFGEKMTLRDLLNADKGRGPSGASPAARGVQGANVAPRGPLIRPDEAATLPPVGLSDIPGLVMRGMAEGAERVPAGRGAGAAFVGAALPRALSAGTTAAKTLRDHPSISPERRQMLKEMEDYISGLNQADRPAVDPKMRALEERLEPPMAGGGAARKLTARAAARAEARLAEKAAKEAAERAAKQAAIDARTPTERAVVEKFGQKQEQEAARAKRVEQISQADAPQRDVKPTGRRVKVAPDVYRVMADTQGDAAVLQAARAGQHLKPTPQGYVGAPRTVTNPQALGGMRRAMDKDFADAVEAVRLADPERLGTWYDRAKQGIAESAEPYQLPRTLEQHGVYSAGVSPESELGFALKHLNSRAAGEPAMAYRGAPMRNLDEAVAQNRPANMGFKIGEYMNKNDPRIPNEGLFGVNDFRRAQGMGYTDPAGNPWKAGVSETMHPFMDAETALQVDRANRGAIGGRTDWAGPHIQEVPWVYGKAQDLYSRGKSGRFGGDELEGIKSALVEANNTARDYMYKHAASATHEAVPGASLGHVSQVLSMTPEEKLAYGNVGRWDRPAPEMELSDLPGVGAGNRDVLYGALGYRQLPSRQAEGLYINKLGQVETNPMTIARPLMDFPTGGGGLMAPESRKVADTLEQFRAFMDAQEAGAYNLPNTMSAVKNKNSLLLDSRNLNPDKLGDPSAGVIPTSDQLARLNAAMEGTGFGVSATNRGVVVFPYDPTMDAKEAAKILRKKQGELTAIYPSDPQKSLTTMGYVPGIGKRSAEGPLSTVPFSGEATGDLLKAFSELNPAVAQNLSESEFVRQIIRDKALRDAKLGGTRRDIQESRRFFSEADWPKAVELIRKGMSTAAALAALGYSASSMAEEGR
jgi:hypothetical protein